MIYLSEFYFPSQNSEANYLAESPRAKMTCYDSFYPFGLFAGRGLKALDLADVTILYGGNGSGKTTALNVMADALRLQRGAQYNRSDFFPDYVSLCQFHTLHAIPAGSLILTSDDVFDYMLDVRAINDNIDTRRGSLFDEYTEARTAKFQMHSMEDYDRLKQVSAARRYSKSQVARKTLSPNIRTHSNGESAFLMFQEKLRGDALYLLDEPENSLSAARQIALADFLADSAGFTAASLCWPPIRRFCWQSPVPAFMIWTVTQCAPAAGPSWKACGIPLSFSNSTRRSFDGGTPILSRGDLCQL